MTDDPKLSVLPLRPDAVVIEVCREMLAMAEAGKIVSVAVVAMAPNNHVITHTGGQRMDMLAGQLALLQHNILANMRDGARDA